MTIYVRNNDVDKAMRILKKKLHNEGMTKELREKRHFTPPGESAATKYVCPSWSKSIPYNNRATIQATFREVFEP